MPNRAHRRAAAKVKVKVVVEQDRNGKTFVRSQLLDTPEQLLPVLTRAVEIAKDAVEKAKQRPSGLVLPNEGHLLLPKGVHA